MFYKVIKIIKISKAPLRYYIPLLISATYLATYGVLVSLFIQKNIEIVLSSSFGWEFVVLNVLFMLSGIVFMICFYSFGVVKEKINQTILHNIRQNIIVGIIENNQEKSENHLNILIEDSVNLSTHVTQTYLPIFQSIIGIIVGIFISAKFNLKLTSIVLLFIPFLYFFHRNRLKKIESNYSRLLMVESKQVNFLESVFSSLPIIRIFNIKHQIFEKSDRYFEDKINVAINNNVETSKLSSYTEGLIRFVEAIIVVYGLWLVRRNITTLDVVIGIWNISVGSIIYPILDLPDLVSGLTQKNISFDRIASVVKDFADTNYAIQNRDSLQSKLDISAIVLKEVCYRNGEDLILNKVNLNISKNKITYFVGESGSGKSTLIKVVLGILKYTNGAISVVNNGRIESITDYEINQIISYVPQSIDLINGASIYENFSLSVESEETSDFLKLSEDLNLHSIIKELPKGYESIVGKDVELSVGQKQKISIMRALLNAKNFVVLDEPFSALDKQSTVNLIEVLNVFKKHFGIIIVTHDKNTINHGENVYKIIGGKVYDFENKKTS